MNERIIFMKNKITQIMTSTDFQSAEKRAQALIALAIIKDEPRHGDDDKIGDELVALREVLNCLSECDPNEVAVSLDILPFLFSELEFRAQAFGRASTVALFNE